MKALRMPPQHLLERRADARRRMNALHLEMRDATAGPLTPGKVADIAARMEALADELEQITRDMVEAVSSTHH